jgi:hypothetical protein
MKHRLYIEWLFFIRIVRVKLTQLPYALLGVSKWQLRKRMNILEYQCEYANLNPIQRFLKSKGA